MVSLSQRKEDMDHRMNEAMLDRLKDGRLPCHEAHAIAAELGVEPLVVGLAANDADIRISRCQLGLFGYGPKSEGKHKIVHAAERVPERLAAYIRARAVDHGITCAATWEAADRLGFSRIEAASVVEAMGLRVSRCQLGCFPRPRPE
jgi:hypothetical protein